MAKRILKTEILGVKLVKQEVGQYSGIVNGFNVAYSSKDSRRRLAESYAVKLFGAWLYYPTKGDAINAIITQEERNGVISRFHSIFTMKEEV